MGITIPEAYRRVTKKSRVENERRQLISKVKNLLAYELDLNLRLVAQSEDCSLESSKTVISRYYYLLDSTRSKLFLELYTKLENYNALKSAEKQLEPKEAYLNLINNGKESLQNWYI